MQIWWRKGARVDRRRFILIVHNLDNNKGLLGIGDADSTGRLLITYTYMPSISQSVQL